MKKKSVKSDKSELTDFEEFKKKNRPFKTKGLFFHKLFERHDWHYFMREDSSDKHGDLYNHKACSICGEHEGVPIRD